MRKVREMVHGGDLGELLRITWIATSWFRTNAYYASGGCAPRGRERAVGY